MNLSTTDLRNYWTEFHETWWSYRYMILVGPKVFSFVVKGVKVIFLGLQRGWGYYRILWAVVDKFMVRGKKGEERGEE
jgi:hypothetical protein